MKIDLSVNPVPGLGVVLAQETMGLRVAEAIKIPKAMTLAEVDVI
ncbi:hypothetical protein [Arthrobacter sp. yr096]|nr:hypothetical protein [Arthrobacter sp. yr096]